VGGGGGGVGFEAMGCEIDAVVIVVSCWFKILTCAGMVFHSLLVFVDVQAGIVLYVGRK